MLFYISGRVVHEIEKGGMKRTDCLQAVRYLADGCREGVHYLLSDIANLEKLAKEPALGELEQRVYMRLAERAPTIASIYDSVDCIAVVTLRGAEPKILAMRGKKIIAIPCRSLHRSVTMPPVLLGEDENDTKFYGIVGRHTIERKFGGGFSLAYEPVGGGGQNTHKPFARYQSNMDRLCLCILDSDVKAPGLSIGETSKKLVDIYENKPICHLHIITTRDSENLLPLSFFENGDFPEQAKKDLLGYINASRKNNCDAWMHTDIKEGISARKVIAAGERSAFSIYWRSKNYNNVKLDDVICYECKQNQPCKITNNNGCSYYITPPMGEKALNKFNQKYCTEVNSLEIEEAIRPIWDQLGHLMASWFCAPHGPLAT